MAVFSFLHFSKFIVSIEPAWFRANDSFQKVNSSGFGLAISPEGRQKTMKSSKEKRFATLLAGAEGICMRKHSITIFEILGLK